MTKLLFGYRTRKMPLKHVAHAIVARIHLIGRKIGQTRMLKTKINLLEHRNQIVQVVFLGNLRRTVNARTCIRKPFAVTIKNGAFEIMLLSASLTDHGHTAAATPTR